MLVGVMTEITLQPVRRYMVLFVTRDKATTVWEGEGISPWTGSAQHPLGKSIWNSSDAT